MEVQDLMQLGMVGLVEAANKYSPQEDVPFEAYAKTPHPGSNSRSLTQAIKPLQGYDQAKKRL